MTIRHQIELETLSFLSIAIFVGSFFVWRSNQNFQNQLRAVSPIVSENDTQKIIVPIAHPTLKIETASQTSPDGTKKLTMKKTYNSDGTSTFVFAVMDGSGENESNIYTTKIEASENFSIPFNTWSPDNKYVFIQKNDTDAWVLKANGQPITTDQTYIAVEELFMAKVKNAVLKEVTGWASATLLIVNTTKEDNTKGPSYWFEVPSKAIIMLSSRF